MREATYAPGELVHPEMIGGALTWVPGRGANELADQLRDFDPRLTLAFHGKTKRWELWRLDGHTYNLVGRSRPGLPFPTTLLRDLQAMDTRQGHDPYTAAKEHNDRLDRERDAVDTDLGLERADRLRFALEKDIGHLL